MFRRIVLALAGLAMVAGVSVLPAVAASAGVRHHCPPPRPVRPVQVVVSIYYDHGTLTTAAPVYVGEELNGFSPGGTGLTEVTGVTPDGPLSIVTLSVPPQSTQTTDVFDYHVVTAYTLAMARFLFV